MIAVALSLLLMSTAAKGSSARAVFEKRCSLCHPASRALGTIKSGEKWGQTVLRMKLKAGGRIGDEEAETIIEYLTESRGK